jgi:hypothetical protein
LCCDEFDRPVEPDGAQADTRRRRRAAAVRAWRESALFDTVRVGSRFNARVVARERRGDGFFLLPAWPARYARSALLRVRADTWPFFGGFKSTPARRAFDNPIAIACLVERAPCFPSRTCSISSRTNSPAWVVGALPCRFACLARRSVFCSGNVHLAVADQQITMHPGCHLPELNRS